MTKKLNELELTKLKMLAAVLDKERETLRFAQYRTQIATKDMELYVQEISQHYQVKMADVNWETGELIEVTDGQQSQTEITENAA